MLFQKKSPHTTGCMLMQLLMAALLLLAALAGFLGMYKTHFLSEGIVFGTSSGSLAIVAFSVSTYFFLKQLRICFTKCEICMK